MPAERHNIPSIPACGLNVFQSSLPSYYYLFNFAASEKGLNKQQFCTQSILG